MPLPASDYWPHAPLHLLGSSGTYFVTASTYRRLPHFVGPARLEYLCRNLLAAAQRFGWQLEAWAVFANHYHFVAKSPSGGSGAASLRPMLSQLHELTANWVNRQDLLVGRKVWFNFRETLLTFQRSYLARLSYVHENAARHGLVRKASDYPWCSAAWFEQTATGAQIATLRQFDGKGVQIEDDFALPPEW